MPSSMWGRFHGQFDLAYFFAYSLKRKYFPFWQIKHSPTLLYWKTHKRAHTQKINHPHNETYERFLNHLPKSKTLIIDDMITEGTSAERLAQSLGIVSDIFTLVDSKRG